MGVEIIVKIWYNLGSAEVCPSGLRSMLGKRVCGQPYRRFESSRFRHFLFFWDLCYNIADWGEFFEKRMFDERSDAFWRKSRVCISVLLAMLTIVKLRWRRRLNKFWQRRKVEEVSVMKVRKAYRKARWIRSNLRKSRGMFPLFKNPRLLKHWKKRWISYWLERPWEGAF